MSASERRRSESHHGKQRVLAATGLLATVAGGGLGAAAVTAAEAQAASGVVHACYRKSTHALKYTKSAKCAKGSKLVTWNKQGPQGVAGAPGAQGPAGPAEGWAGEAFSTSQIIASRTDTVVAEFTPASSGYFAVNGAVTASHAPNLVSCWLKGGTAAGNSTPSMDAFGRSSRPINIATTGIIKAGPTAPVYEECYFASGGDVHDAAVTGVHLTAAHVAIAARKGAHKSGGAYAAKAGNRFSKK